MAKFFKQIKGKLVEYDGENECLTFNRYKYGTLNNETYSSDTIPACNVCGSELLLQKKKGYFLIIGCSNKECETNNCNKGGDTKLKAFLPEYYYNKIREKRKHPSWFDKNYLINKKGLSNDEADEVIKKVKENISNKNKGHNKKYFIEKFGDKYTQDLKKRNHLCKEYWIKRGYTEDEAVNEIKKIQQYSASKVKNYFKLTKENLLSKGIDPDTFNKNKSIFCIEYWIKRGYNENEAKTKISEIQHNISLKNKNRVSNKNVKYWQKRGFTEEEAKLKISEIQSTFTLDKCIQKYGEIDGRKRWKERQEKWQKSLHENGNLHIGYSNVSQELFNEIIKHYPEDEKDYVFYATKNREYSLKNEQGKYYYAYDFTDLNRRKIIEFNGDIYHGNPNIFKDDDRPNPFYQNMTAKDIHDKDEEKILLAKNNGFDTLTIWESDYRNNKNKTIKEALNFINNGK